MKKLIYSFAFLLLVLLQNSIAQKSSYDPLALITTGSEAKVITSLINGTDYKLYINLPADYDAKSSKKYPVLYKLDGQWSFVSIVSSYYAIRYDGFIPDVIIVGVSYAGENPDYNDLRTFDFTPIETYANTGGAPELLRVFEEEIIPFVEKNYKTDKNNRTLAGTSYGGLFTTYTLFSKPELFNGYIITNPSLWYGDGFISALENRYASQHSKLDARVFLAYGEHDMVPLMKRLSEQIEKRNYKDLVFKSRMLEGMGHSGSKAEAHARGLIHIYAREIKSVAPQKLQKYLGTYNTSRGGVLEVVLHEGHLAFKSFYGVPNVPIYSHKDQKFSLNRSYNLFEFIINEQEIVTGFKVELFQGDFMNAIKIQ